MQLVLVHSLTVSLMQSDDELLDVFLCLLCYVSGKGRFTDSEILITGFERYSEELNSSLFCVLMEYETAFPF